MAHEIDEIAPGVHGFASARLDAWHQLGHVFDSDAFTAEEAMQHAHLGGWNVRKVPLTLNEVTEEGVTSIEVPDKFATVRTNPVTGATEYLGTVGNQYVPIQNEEHAGLLQALVDESGAVFDTAGSLRGGKETFITMKMPEDIQLGGHDAINLNLVALNSHDGQSSFRFLVSPVRVVCANTVAAAVRGAKASFAIRHTVSAGRELQEAREALGLTWKYVEAFQVEAEKLMSASMTNRAYDAFAKRLLNVEGKKKDDMPKTLATHLEGMHALWRDSSTLDGIRGTKWGAYQTVVEYFDHYAPVRGKEDAAMVRALRNVVKSDTTRLKLTAFNALAGVR